MSTQLREQVIAARHPVTIRFPPVRFGKLRSLAAGAKRERLGREQHLDRRTGSSG
jgi:hypothetical protein